MFPTQFSIGQNSKLENVIEIGQHTIGKIDY